MPKNMKKKMRKVQHLTQNQKIIKSHGPLRNVLPTLETMLKKKAMSVSEVSQEMFMKSLDNDVPAHNYELSMWNASNAWRMAYDAGIGVKPKDNYKPGSQMDTHCWLVHKKTGEILDPTPDDEPYDRAVNKHYRAFQGKDKLMCFLDWKKRWEHFINVELLDEVANGIEDRQNKRRGTLIRDERWKSTVKKVFMNGMVEEPQTRRCYYNCVCLLASDKKIKEDYELAFGSLGYEMQKGKVFWEFG